MVAVVSMAPTAFACTPGIDREADESVLGERVSSSLNALSKMTLRPMAVDVQHCGEWTVAVWNVEASSCPDCRSGQEMQALDAVSIALNGLCDLTIQREALLILDICVLGDKSPQFDAVSLPILKTGWQCVGAR